MADYQSKINFIVNLVERGGLSDDEFRRLRKLAAAEIRSIEERGGSQPNGIIKLRKRLMLDSIGGDSEPVTYSGKSNKTKTSKKSEEKEQDIRAVQPPNQKAHHVAEFMNLFNDPEGLKYLTHDYDPPEPFDIDEFLIKTRKVFDEETDWDKGLKISKQLFTVVKNFAFEPELGWTGFGSNNAYRKSFKGWTTPDILNWSRNLKEQQSLEAHPIHHQDFKREIEAFRNVTRIKAPGFMDLVKQSSKEGFKTEIANIGIEYNRTLRSVNFYTHVPNIKNALKFIFTEISKKEKHISHKKAKPRVEVCYSRSEEQEYRVGIIEIIHYDSYVEDQLLDICKKWLSESDKGSGGMRGIKYNLNGYCDWSVESKAIDGDIETAFRINILRSIKSMKPFEEIPENDIVGFKHIIKFYYK